MAGHNAFGLAAERRAAELFEARGWTVLERNWRWRRREIDLVVRRGRVVAFVEVRARRGDSHGHPLETIGRAKRRGIELAARAWIARHGRADDEYRFDAVAVLDRSGLGGRVRLEHVPGAWRVDGR